MTESISATTEELILSKLDSVIARLDQLEARLERAESNVQELPGVAAMATNSMDDFMTKHPEAAVRSAELVPQAMSLLEHWLESGLPEKLIQLLDRTEQIEQSLKMLDELPGVMNMAVDSLDEFFIAQRETLTALVDKAPQILPLLEGFSSPAVMKALQLFAERAEDFAPLMVLAADGAGLFNMSVDSLDAFCAEHRDSLLSLTQKAPEILTLLDSFSSPALLKAMHLFAERADDFAPLLAMAADSAGILNMSMNTLDDFMARLQAQGVNVEERAAMLMKVLLMASEPQTLQVLMGMLSHRDSLLIAAELFRDAPGIASMAVDTADEMWRHLGLDMQEFVGLAKDIRSGIMDPKSVAVVAAAGKAVADSALEERSVGPWQMFKALSQPGMRKTLGFALNFAQHFSTELQRARERN